MRWRKPLIHKSFRIFYFYVHVFLFLVFFFSDFRQDTDRTSYYGLFDGHGGTDAAAYTVSHLHSEIAASQHYPDRPAEALREAFITTDKKFIAKSKKLVNIQTNIRFYL